MTLTRLSITNFRNITEVDLALSNRLNIFVGANGSGKTNLLEAIYFLGHGKSFRQATVAQTIQYTKPRFLLHGSILQNEKTISIGMQKNRQGEAKLRIDEQNANKVAQLTKLLPMQLINSESSYLLLRGGIKYRCAYLDWGCFHHQPAFFTAWYAVKRLLRQRNAALKTAKYYQQLQIWDQALIPLAEQISSWREHYSGIIVSYVNELCALLLPEYKFTFYFQRGWDYRLNYGNLLENQFSRDCAATYTLLGPHRAELQINVNDIPATACLSRGQLKLLIYALRLAQGNYFIQQTGQNCLCLIDDFSAELDNVKCQLLIKLLGQVKQQLFINAIEQQQLAELIDKKGAIFYVRHGKITR